MNMHKVVHFLWFAVLVIAGEVCLVRTDGAFWQLMAKELHSQCLRMDTVACIGFKIQRATAKDFINNKTNDVPEMDRQVDKMLIHKVVDYLNFSHWQTGREIKEKFRTLDSILDVIIDVAKSGFKQYDISKGPNGGSRRKTMFLPLLMGIVLKVIGLVPLLLGKLAFIGLIAFFVSKLSLAIVAVMSLKKLFQSYSSPGVPYYGYPYYYYAHPHEYYENTVQHVDYPQQNHEHGHYEYPTQPHYGYTHYYSPGSYQGHNVGTGRQQRNLRGSYQDISSAVKPSLETIVPDAAGVDNEVFGQKQTPSFYTPMRRRRRGIRKLRDLVPLQKDVGIAGLVLNARNERDDSLGAGQKGLSQASRST